MRHLLIGSILMLAACSPDYAEEEAQMVTCGDATSPDIAIAACNQLLDHEALPHKARVYVYYSRSRAAMEKQDFAAAVSDLDESIRLDGSQAVSFATRGIVHGEMGDMEAAIVDFSRAIELDPQDAVAFENRGKALSEVGRHQRAIQDFTHALELGNDEAATRNDRCWARALWGQELHLAREDCDAAVRMRPDVSNIHDSLAFVRIAPATTPAPSPPTPLRCRSTPTARLPTTCAAARKR